jgi:hypothetical protein
MSLYVSKSINISIQELTSNVDKCWDKWLNDKKVKASIKESRLLFKEDYPRHIEFIKGNIIQTLYNFNQCLIHGRPHNKIKVDVLNPTWNKFEIFYVNPESEIEKIWFYELSPIFGMDINRDKSQSKWVFTSHAVGMSRLLDATGLFSHRCTQLGMSEFQFA